MAKTAAAKTPAAAAAAAANDNGTSGSSAIVEAPEMDELAGLDLGDDVNDGLGEIDREDIRIPAYVFNMKGTGPDGRAIPKDVYYNTVDEQYVSEVDAVFCLLHKTNLYARYNDTEDKTETLCKSYDRVDGTWTADGHQRKCEGCPDAEWRNEPDPKTGKQKRMRNCSVVYNVISVDRLTRQPFVVRFKKTGLPAFRAYLQKHHIGRRVLKSGKRANYPLFAFHCRLTAQMANAKANYAVPVLERAGVLSGAEIDQYAQMTLVLAQQARVALDRAEEQEARREAGDAAADFNPDKFAGDAGQDFTDATADANTTGAA